MATRIVTQELVNQAAQTLADAGKDPSVIAVKDVIGGGSYSTIKPLLEVWKKERHTAAANIPSTPPEIEAKALDMGRAIWVMATQAHQKEMGAVKADAANQIQDLTSQLKDANAEIARLDASELEHTATLQAQAAQLREVELALAEAQVEAKRAQELARELTELRSELETVRKEGTEKAIALGHASGEAQALREQLRQLTAAVKPPGGKSKP